MSLKDFINLQKIGEGSYSSVHKDAFFDETSHSLCIIMELAENGDLAKKIETAKKRTMSIPEEEIWVIALHMLRGLKAMHSKKILHRDLKCANVFAS